VSDSRWELPGQARADRLVVCISDVEMGAGGILDDFPHSAFLGELLLKYAAAPFDRLMVDVVFNGDTFDLLKTSVDGAYPVRITAEVAVAKMQRVIDHHAAFFDGVRQFLEAGRRRVFFVTGNHDPELVYPEVQALIRDRIGLHDEVYFPGFAVSIGDALIEHGSQADGMFRVPPEEPFLSYKGQRLLQLPWGAVALLEAAMPLQRHLYWADRLKPRKLVFDLLPELREVLVSAFWTYWTRDYWRGLFEGDPVKQVSWTLFREVAYRFGSQDPDVGLGDIHQRRLQRDDQWRVRSVGHHHQAVWWSFADRKLLATGCFRDEFVVAADGSIRPQPLPKVYAEIYQHQGRSVRSHLVEVDGPPAQPDAVPLTVQSMRASVQQLLGPDEERRAELTAREAQERDEASGAVEEPGDR